MQDERTIPRTKQESGFAMVTVVLVVMIITILVGVMLDNVSSELSGLQAQKGKANALRTGDGGIDAITYLLGQGTNWADLDNSYSTPTVGSMWASRVYDNGSGTGWATDGNKGRWRAHIDVDPDSDAQRILTVEGEYPAGSGQFSTIQATVRRDVPEAFDYAVFADKGVDIHHHNSSFITPTMVTPKIHSNGYVNVDWSTKIHVDTLTAAAKVTLAKGGGTLPNGSAIPAAGYNWSYYLPHALGNSGANLHGDPDNYARCFPSKKFPPQDFTAGTWNWPNTTAPYACPASPKFTGNAMVMGDIAAKEVWVKARGDTSKYAGNETCAATTQAGINDPITNVCIATRNANIDAGKVTLDVPALVWTGPGSGNSVVTHFKAGTTPAPCTLGPACVADCTTCNQGSADASGAVGGVVNIHPAAWAPGTIPFPSLDFRTKYYGVAKIEQGEAGTGANGCKTTAATLTNTAAAGTTGNVGNTCHIFPTADGVSFINYIANPLNISIPGSGVGSPYNSATDCTKCIIWLDANRKVLAPTTANKLTVQYVVVNGTYFFQSGTNFDLSWDVVKSAFGQNIAIPTSPAPTIMVKGAIIVELGTATLESSITVVGPEMDPFLATLPTADLPVGATTEPGVFAVGGNITVRDYDDDDAWNSTGIYERYKRNTVTMRGIVYSGVWDAATQTSLARDQHWHSYDVKNQETIIGAQIGGKLHDCNSFVFSYDPLVKNLSTFTSGAPTPAYVLEWKQIASTP